MAYTPNNPNGQATSANSAPVVIASDQSAVPVSASSLPLPTGAATSANQTNVQSAIGTAAGTAITIQGSALGVAVPVSGTVAINGLASGGNTLAIGTSGNILVSGLAGIGSTPILNPISISGVDGGGLKRHFLLDTDGTINANVTKINGVTVTPQLINSVNRIPVVLGSATTPGTSAPNWVDIFGGVDNGGLARSLSVDTSGRLNINTISGAISLPTGAATETTLSAINTKTPALGQANNANSSPVVISSQQTSTVPAPRGSQALITTPAPQSLFRTTFSSTIGSGVDTNFFTLIQTGTGQTISQSSGNLVFASGTTANSETIIRSNVSFAGSLVARIQTILSQRIVNNNFFVELVDVIGDSLAVTVNSATSITVTIPSNPFTAANVGQSMYVGAVQNISATAVPGRYAIASVSGNNVTFTVAGWPASGSGTCSLFGWNYYQLVYTGVTATAANYDAQRRGYASGATAATINTTASPGHMAVMANNDGNAYFADQLTASAAGTVQLGQRASRVVNLADENANLVLQLRTTNGTVAPASTTTWTVGTVSVENYTATSVVINDVKPLGSGNQVPVTITNTPNINTVTTVSGVTTVTTVSTVSAVTSANLGTSSLVADVASAALTTTTTTAAITPTFGTAYEVNIPVTVVSGTNPTLDVGVEESDDTGTNWYRVYDFPRITATGMYRSPVLRLRGNRVRYVQTVGGTTPSFTRAINRLQQSVPGSLIGQFIDRTIAPNTLNSTSPTYYIEGMVDLSIIVRCTAQSSAATIGIDLSDDAVNWNRFSKTITTVNGFSAPLTLSARWRFIRLIVTSAGSGITLAEATIKSGEIDTDLATETTLLALSAKTPALGQAAMTGSSPVVIASDQSAIPASQSGTWNINNISGTVSLPTGAATSANQTTANSSLSSIDSKTPSLGQKAMTASSPVVIASDQSAIPASQSGTWNINNISGIVSLPTGAATSANQTTANSSLSSIDSKTPSLGQKAMVGSAPVVIASDQSAIPALQSGTWNINNISGTVSLPTGAATSVNQTNGSQKAQIVDGSGNVIGSTGNALDVNIKSGVSINVNLDQSSDSVAVFGNDGTTNRALKTNATGELQVGIVSSALPTGAATSANQTTANSSLSSIDSKFGSLGQKAMVGSAPVVIASDQSAIPASQSGTWNINNISGTVSLPTGAATETTLSSINTKIPANLTVSSTRLLVDGSGVTQPVSGSVSVSNFPATQNVAVTSLPVSFNSGNADSTTQRVVIASDQSTVSVSATSLPLPTGAATSANQTNVQSAVGTSASTAITIQGSASGVAVPVSGTVTVNGISGTVSLPTGAATSALQTTGNTSLSSIDTKTPSLGQANSDGSMPVVLSSNQTSTVPAARGSQAVITTPAPQALFRTTFAAAVPSGVDTNFFTVVQSGSGQTVSQSGGKLVLASGTTANSETIVRSNTSFVGSLIARAQTTLSQRIVNNNFFVELVDVIGDNLAVTVNSATSITVTIPSSPFTSVNVGQSVYVGAVQNISAAAVPGRYAIASVSGNNVTFTVAGWPASGSGTCSLFGWNYYQLVYNGTTATSANYDSQRRGYNSGFTAATINTTASPGHMAVMNNTDGNAYFSDQLVASAAGTVQLTQRASRVVNLADETANLVLQLRSSNGSTAPASTTTWTIGTVSVENYTPTSVVVNDVKPLGPGNQLPVAVTNTPNIGTVTTVTGVTTVSTVTSVTGVAGMASWYTSADQASAAITTTTTSTARTITNGTVLTVNVNITVVSGTTPTYDFALQESVDGAVWTTIWQAPRQTAVSTIVSPPLIIRGQQYRYIETIGGTTPSFTRTITTNRNISAGVYHKTLIDRTLNPATANSATASLNVEGCSSLGMIVLLGTGGTGNIQIALDGSDDGTNWVQGLTFVNVVAASTVPVQAFYNMGRFRFIRARTVTAQTSSTLSYITLIGSYNDVQTPPGRKIVTQYTVASTSLSTTYTQIVASTIADVHMVETFDSSGSSFIIGVGGSGSEVTQIYVFPGGSGQQPLFIPAGSRIAVRTTSGTPTGGTFFANFYGV